jgi:hypothetical protein
VVQKRTHVFLPGALLSDIDQLFGKGKRSAFLTGIVEREVRKAKLLRALEMSHEEVTHEEVTHEEVTDGTFTTPAKK